MVCRMLNLQQLRKELGIISSSCLTLSTWSAMATKTCSECWPLLATQSQTRVWAPFTPLEHPDAAYQGDRMQFWSLHLMKEVVRSERVQKNRIKKAEGCSSRCMRRD